jgi:acyl-CoA reductase-like NAD-dependent aldehyde dehydrogenase
VLREFTPRAIRVCPDSDRSTPREHRGMEAIAEQADVVTVRNPATGEPIGAVATFTAGKAAKAIGRARARATTLAATPAHERSALLNEVARRI